MRQLAFTVPSFALLLAFSPRPDFPSAERITPTFQKRQNAFRFVERRMRQRVRAARCRSGKVCVVLAELVLTIVLQLWRREQNAAYNMRRTACGVHDVAYSISYEGRQLTQCRIALRSSNRGGQGTMCVQNVIERAAPTRRFWDFPRRTRPKHRY